MKKTILIRCVKLLCLLLCLILLSEVAYDFSRYYDHNADILAGFYAEPENSLDVVLVGASEVVAGFSSAYAYDLYGFTSYPYALDNGVLSLFESQVTEIMKHQDPKMLVIDINGVLYDDASVYTDDIRLQRYLNNIPGSWNRVKTILEQVPAENWYYYFYPLAKSHSNWKAVWKQKHEILQYQQIKWNGLALKGNVTYVHDYTAPVSRDVSQDFSSAPMEPESERYLRSFLQHCRENGIDNILFVRFPHQIIDDKSYGRYQRGMDAQRIIAEYGYPYIDMERENRVFGLDYTTDFYDEDHLGVSGQKKLTQYLGGILAEEYGVGESQLTPEQRSSWEKAADYIRLFYQYCADCLEAGGTEWVGEDQWMMDKLEEMKAEGQNPGF